MQPSCKEDAESSIAALAKRDLRNRETGINAQINSTQAKKLISDAAVDKSIANGFTREQHYAIAANIEALWRHAVQVSEGPDTKNNDPKVRIRRFAVPVVIGNETRYVAIMAKKSIEHGNRVYTLEAHGEETLRGMLDALNSETGISSTPARGEGHHGGVQNCCRISPSRPGRLNHTALVVVPFMSLCTSFVGCKRLSTSWTLHRSARSVASMRSLTRRPQEPEELRP